MSKRSSTGQCLEAGVVPTQRKKMVNLSRINTVNTNERYMMYLQLPPSYCCVLFFANKPIAYSMESNWMFAGRRGSVDREV